MLDFLPSHWLIPQSLLGVSFWLALLIVFIIALITIISRTLKSKSRVEQVRQIIKGETITTLYDNSLSITERASASKDKIVHSLWHEFSESLVQDDRTQRVYNTLDAEHFFNHKTLSAGLTSNRLLAATPSFLTAIGVLGPLWA